jgi:hypothetical protein
VPFVPAGILDVVMTSGCGAAAATTIERETETVCAGVPASATVAVNLKVPVAVGVPEIRPLDGSMLNPVGRLPLVMDQA